MEKNKELTPMMELIEKFPNGKELYNENAIFNNFIHCINNGMPIETAFVELIKIINSQQEQMKVLVKNQPQRIILQH